jgi:hypothetical protein
MTDDPAGMGAPSGVRPQNLAGPALWDAAIALGRIAEGTERIKEYVRREPVRALGIALGVGVLTGWWTKRR